MPLTRRAAFRDLGHRLVVQGWLRRLFLGAVPIVVAVGAVVSPAHPEAAKLRSVAQKAAAPAAPPAPPGVPAPPETTAELRRLLHEAVLRFEARDTAGVLAHVSDQYWTSPLTKPRIRDQLVAMFGLYDKLHAQVRIDDVRMVGEHAWVWSTGAVEGRVAWLGRWMMIYSWERELEVARRENGRWRVYGYQQ